MQARYYHLLTNGKIQCDLCPQACQIPVNQAGFCHVRQRREDELLAANYGLVAALALDPIEKKPLYHFYPGRPILSVGTIGCNLACEYCQNWRISREQAAATRSVSPEELCALAEQASREEGSIGLAYTYSEPVVWYEFLLDTMPLIRTAGLRNVLVTNAFLQPEPWRELLKFTDAANIDLKGFDPQFYKRFCQGRLPPVLDNIREAVGQIHLELTTLIIPGANDRPEQIEALTKWIAALDPAIPLHLSRYFPNYRLDLPATPVATMEAARQIAGAHLKYVYLGNLGETGHTYCSGCGRLLIRREGYRTQVLTGETCPDCGEKVPFYLQE
jgi:pyruvate formate lyase activating enzyme